ncbi:MAG TPA: hypothetical protein VHZ32_01035 [Rhizomicrobium sp.]|jgi:hypothetical protein|nr:hypothetical protein [Rhizomicrobium sp.]
MRYLLTITVASLLLAGCAGNYDKQADTHLCESSMPASSGVTSQLFPSSRLTVPARSLLGGGKLDLDDTMTYACVDATNNKINAPQIPNLHKIRLDHLGQRLDAQPQVKL